MTTIQSVIARAVVAQLHNSTNALNANILNLASGYKTNASVADFSVGTVLAGQSSSLTMANINAGQGKSLLQTAKGGLDEVLDLLQELKDLAVQASDDSLTDNELANLNLEAQSLITEIDRLATTTTFNNKRLLDGSISGTASLSTQTGQGTENYTLLDTTHYSLSGTVAAGELKTTSTFAAVESSSLGKTAGSATIAFTVGGAVTNAVMTIGGQTVTFGDGTAASDSAAEVAGLFVAAAEASTNSTIRQFIYTNNGDGTVTVTSADLGTGSDAVNFQLTGTGTNISAATFSGTNLITATRNFGTDGTDGTVRTPTSDTVDGGLQGAFSNFTAALDTTGTNNRVTFTVDLNGTTYTSQQVYLFGGAGAGFNGKGDTIKNGQVIYFYNADGPTDENGEYTDNGFSLTVGATDITIAGGTQDAFETDLTNTANGFLDQLETTRINQARDVVLEETNPSGGDHTIAAATGTTFAGIEGFDAVGANNTGDIRFVGDVFGDDGRIGAIGNFSFNAATHKISVTIDGETYTSDISDSTANTGGIVNGAGSYNSTTRIITVGAGTTLVFHSTSTDDGKQLRIDLSNLDDTSIDLSTAGTQETFTDDLDTLFGVSENPSLSFQVGSGGSNTIGISLNSARSRDIFLDDAGAYQAIDISTTTGASQAQEVIDNAITTVLGLISSAQSGITSFNSAITTNNVMILNFDEASNALLATDYSLESTLMAENMLRVNGAISVLVQEQSRLQSLLQLLSA